MKKKIETAKSILAKPVQFEFLAPEAKQVFLVGDFNNWDTGAHPMKKHEGERWETSIDLKPGRYEYRFFVDSKWENDPTCSSCVPNEFGSCNCVKTVD